MSWETLEPALDLLCASDREEVEVLFIGGEPLLELPLIRRTVSHLAGRGSSKKRINYQIFTNGLLLEPDTVQFLAANDFETQLSFDGIPAAQDFRGQGTHAKLDRLLDFLNGSFRRFFRWKTSVALTLHSGNLRHLADSVAYFLTKEVARIKIAPLITHDDGWHPTDIDELDRQFARIFQQSIDHFEATGAVPLQAFQKMPGAAPSSLAGDTMCNAPSGRTLAVDVDGNITGCTMFAESYQLFPTDFLKTRLETMRLGKVQDLEFKRRLALYPEVARATGLFHNKYEKYSSYGTCRDCPYASECGVCPTSIGHIPGNRDPNRVPDLQCALNLTALRYRAQFPEQPSIMDIISGTAPSVSPALQFLSPTASPAAPGATSSNQLGR
jgi:sulfatase maturation enzyme AslB (radical SAM superfamily)